MRRVWRWVVVVAGTAVVVALPFAVHLVPVGHSSIDAATLLARIQHSADVQYSGYAESTGKLALPVTDRFNSVNDLFGGTTQLRVWWRATDDWRVDSISAAGETDLHADRTGTWTWDYESNTAIRTADAVAEVDGSPRSERSGAATSAPPVVRLPRSADLLPATLARRLLSQASAAQVTRLGDARVAGHDAAGLRVHTADARSTIDHVDVWAVPGVGLPVRVEVYGRGDSVAVLGSALLDLSLAAPTPSDTAFHPAATANVRSGEQGDILTAIEQFGRNAPPPQLAGLDRQHLDLGAIGVYGRGVTMLVAIPLPDRLAGSLADDLAGTPGVPATDAAISIGVGPLNLLLSVPGLDGARWLLIGTVTAATLTTAAEQLPPAVGFRR